MPTHFDRLIVARTDAVSSPSRAFGAYSVTFDGRSLAPGQSVDAASGVTLTRRL